MDRSHPNGLKPDGMECINWKPPSTLSTLMHCIVSGFDPFGNFTYNPTQAIVEALPDKLPIPGRGQQAVLHRLILQTCCEHAWPPVCAVAENLGNEPVILIHTGLADLRSRINFERFALNVRDYRMPDNGQHQPVDEHIDPDGPEGLRTTIPLPALADRLSSQGFLCEVSNHAGSFLCNEVYYRSLRWFQTTANPGAALFVHFPQPETYAESCLREGAAIDRAALMTDPRGAMLCVFREALIETIQFCCAWWLDTELPQTASTEAPVAKSRSDDCPTSAA